MHVAVVEAAYAMWSFCVKIKIYKKLTIITVRLLMQNIKDGDKYFLCE